MHFLGRVAKRNVSTVLASMDALYFSLSGQRLFQFGISPNKLFDYMLAGKPILQAVTAGNDFVQDANCGITVPPEDPNAIADGILKLRDMSPQQRNRLGENGRLFVVEKHDYRILAHDFMAQMTALTATSATRDHALRDDHRKSAENTSVRLKYAFDLFAASVGLIVLVPIFLCIAALIKIDSPGPVFFRQERVGQQSRPFRIHKFRTMHVGAEQDGKLTVAGDARLTRVGRHLRKIKLDELPQLLDVLSGSLVGPRPEVPRYVALYPPEVRQTVLSVRPGITDPAFIAFRNEGEMLACGDPERLYVDRIMPAKLAHYVDYVRTRSFAGDLHIIVRTIELICIDRRASV